MKNYSVLDIRQFEAEKDKPEFYANTVADHLNSGHKNIKRRHKHNFYLTVLFTHGSGTHEIDFITYDVKPGSIFFMNPGQMHHWDLSDDIEGYLFFHTGAYYDLHYTSSRLHDFPFFSSIQNCPLLQVAKEKTENFTSKFREIFDESHGKALQSKHKIISLINLIYIESARLYDSNASFEKNVTNTYFHKFQEFEQFVEHHFKSEKSPSQYANWLNISPKHLNRITRNIVGKTPTDIILERVFLEAKREIMLQKQSLAQIADDLGYDDYPYFSRLFKKKCGETPSSFINKYI